MTRPRRAHRSNSEQRQRAEAISQSPSSATRAKNSRMQQTNSANCRLSSNQSQTASDFFQKKRKKTLDSVHENIAYLSPLAKEREKRGLKPGRTLFFSPLRRFSRFLFLSASKAQCALVVLSFLFPRAAKCKSLSPLSLSLSLSRPSSGYAAFTRSQWATRPGVATTNGEAK